MTCSPVSSPTERNSNGWSPLLSAVIGGLIDREVREFIASDEFAEIWTQSTPARNSRCSAS